MEQGNLDLESFLDFNFNKEKILTYIGNQAGEIIKEFSDEQRKYGLIRGSDAPDLEKNIYLHNTEIPISDSAMLDERNIYHVSAGENIIKISYKGHNVFKFEKSHTDKVKIKYDRMNVLGNKLYEGISQLVSDLSMIDAA